MKPETRTKIPLLAFLIVVIAAVPLLNSNPYVLNILILAGIHIILAASNRLILRMGVWFLGHAAFYAIGVYTVLLARDFLSLNYWFSLPLAGLTAGLIALGFGYATARVKGMSFCIITVALVEVVKLTIVRLGGGRPVMCAPPETLLGLDFNSKVHYYYLILVLVLFTLYILNRVEKSRFGRNIIAIAEAGPLAESLGINTRRHRIFIMSLCCFFAGLAGGFFAPYVRVVGYSTFTLNASIIILFYVVVGGSRSVWGAVIGATFLTVLPEFLPGQAAVQNILYAAIILVSLFFLPGGLISLPEIIHSGRPATIMSVLRKKTSTGDKKEVL